MKVIAAFFVAISLAVAGCASVGNEQIRSESQATVDQKLVKGKTTKAEVVAIFGSADETSFTDSGNEIWRYRHVVATAKAVNFIPFINMFAAGADEQKKEIVILFDKNGVVSNYTFSATQGEVRQGIFAK